MKEGPAKAVDWAAPTRADESSAEFRTPPLGDTAGVPAGVPTVPGYDLHAEIGRGGMGAVYRARHLALSRPVAVKMLLPECVPTEAALARFRTEMEAAARLQHPNIVRVYEVGVGRGSPYLVMEWVGGGTLAEAMARGPLEPPHAAGIVAALARAAEFAHRLGVVHRDLKPGNVLLEEGAADSPGAVPGPGGSFLTPKVCDFSLAKCLDSDDGQTRTGAVLGTPGYMAPEQAGGKGRDAGPAADIFSLGVILYEALTGQKPFRGATVLETLDLVRHADPLPPERFRPKLPRDLRTICLKCLEKAPAKRYAAAGDLAADLERFALGLPVLARPVSSAERAVRWAKRRPTAAALVVVSCTAPVGSLVGLLVHNDRLRGEVERTNIQARETGRQKAAALDSVRRGHEALDGIFTSLDNGPVGVAGNPAYRAMYSEQAESILRFYHEVLPDGDDADAEVRFHRGLVAVYAGRMQLRLRNWPATEADFRRGCDLLAPLAAAPDATAERRREYAHACYWLGTVLLETGRIEDAAPVYTRAAAYADGPAPRDRRTAGLSHYRLAEIGMLRQRIDEVDRHAAEADGHWDHLLAADAGNEIDRMWALKTLQFRATACTRSQTYDALAALASRAAAARAWYAAHPPLRGAAITGRIDLAETYRLLANGRLSQHDAAAAAGHLAAAIELTDAVLRAEPTAAAARARAAALYRDRAMLHGPAADPADWDRAVELADAGAVLGYRLERAFAKLEVAGPDAVLAELIAVAADPSLTAVQAAETARAFAHVVAAVANGARIAAENRGAFEDEVAARAVGCVRRAVEGRGFESAAAFHAYAANPVIAAVFARPEFADTLVELERRAADPRPK